MGIRRGLRSSPDYTFAKANVDANGVPIDTRVDPFTFLDAYDGSASYPVGAVVTTAAGTFRANTPLSGVAPPGDGWDTIALSGADGAPGADGAAGESPALAWSIPTATTSITTGIAMKMPVTLNSVTVKCATAPVGSSLIVDVLVGGVSVFASQTGLRPEIPVNAYTLKRSAKIPPSTQSVVAGTDIQVQCTSVGSTTPATGVNIAVDYDVVASPFEWTNIFEGLANNTNITAGNSGGASGDAFTSTAGGANFKASTSNVAFGSVGALVTPVPTGSGGGEQGGKVALPYDVKEIWIGGYFYFLTNAGGFDRIMTLFNNGAIGTALVYTGAAKKIQGQDSVGPTNSVFLSSALTTLQQVLIEMHAVAGNPGFREVYITSAGLTQVIRDGSADTGRVFTSVFDEVGFGRTGLDQPNASDAYHMDGLYISTVGRRGAING